MVVIAEASTRSAQRPDAEHALPVEAHLAEGRAHAEIVARAAAIEIFIREAGLEGRTASVELRRGDAPTGPQVDHPPDGGPDFRTFSADELRSFD